MRIVGYLLLTAVLVAIVVGGLLVTSKLWLPSVNAALGSQVEANKFLVIIPAAVATLTAALFNGIASLIVASIQRKTAVKQAKDRADFEDALDKKRRDATEALATARSTFDDALDQKRRDSVDELEKKKSEYTRSLEDHKTGLAKELDDHRTELTKDLDEHRDVIAKLDEAREVAGSYRYQIGLMQMGAYSAKEVAPLRPKLALVRDGLERGGELYQAWCAFMQWGHALEEAAAGKRPVAQRRVWLEIDPGKPAEHVGLQFAQSAECVLRELDVERDRLRTKKSAPVA